MGSELSIGFVARQTGCTVPTIRYYESIGLLPVARRSEAGQRHFDTADHGSDSAGAGGGAYFGKAGSRDAQQFEHPRVPLA